MRNRKHIPGHGKPPKKGTKARDFLLKALRPEGVRIPETSIAQSNAGSVIAVLRDQKGYDIRTQIGERVKGRSTPNTYRCVGKYRPDGGYRPFRNYDDERREA